MLCPLESEIVAALQSLGSGTIRDVVDELQKRDVNVAYTTVSTILYRLWKKKLIQRRTESYRGGTRHLYSYRNIETEYIDNLLAGLITAFGKRGVVHLAEKLEELSPEELERLRRRLEK